MADISITITGRVPAGKSVALLLRPELNNLERALERAGIRDVKVATNLVRPPSRRTSIRKCTKRAASPNRNDVPAPAGTAGIQRQERDDGSSPRRRPARPQPR